MSYIHFDIKNYFNNCGEFMFYFALIILLLIILAIASMFLINKVPRVSISSSHKTKDLKKEKEALGIEDEIDLKLLISDEIFKDLPTDERIIFLEEQHSGYILEIEKGQPLGKNLDLIGTIISIGRSSTSDITIDDQLITEKHAVIKIIPGQDIMITDLKSTNGTSVNDEVITTKVLHENDVLLLGKTKLKFKKELK